MVKKIVLMILVVVTTLFLDHYLNNNRENLVEVSYGDTSYILGDVDGNGKITVSDYNLVKTHILGTTKLTGDKFKRADVNRDNKITTADYNSIRNMIVNNTKIVVQGEETISKNSSATTKTDEFPKVIKMTNYYEVVDFSVIDFGADNTGVKDSSAAFNSALKDALECSRFGLDHGGNKQCSGVVYVPEGVYLLEKPIELGPYVKLVGNPNKTVLLINHGLNNDSVKNAAVKTSCMSSIKNIIFYYPQQVVTTSGDAYKYPPTITYGIASEYWHRREASPSDGISLENVTFINSYIAMDFSTVNGNNSVFFLKDIYGTPLKTGILNDENIDTIKMDNINFSAKYWLDFSNKKKITLKKVFDEDFNIEGNVLDKALNAKAGNCGFYKKTGESCVPYKPAESDLKKALKNSTRKPVGIELKRVDWAFLAKINISGYYSGVRLSNSTAGVDNQVDNGRFVNTEGEMFDSKILDCIYPFDVVNSRHFVLTKVTLDSNGGAAIKVDNNTSKDTKVYNVDSEYSIYNSVISNYNTSDQYAINYGGKGPISITNSKVYGKVNIQNGNKLFSFSGSAMLNTGMDSVTHDKNNTKCYVEKTPTLTSTFTSDYDKTVKTIPKSDKMVVISIEKGTFDLDITAAITKAIQKLAVQENGKTVYKGIVYIPNGKYVLKDTINVPSGVEIRGGATWAHNSRYLSEYAQNIGATVIDITSLNNKSAFKLNGSSGINGIDLITTKKVANSAYAIDGSGNNIYVINMSMPGLYRGIHINGDNHFIENIWGAFYNVGIKVEGKNGIIRNSHFSPTAMIDKSSSLGNEIRNNQTTIQVGSTEGEMIFHVFTIGQKKAFVFDKAKNFTAIGIGADGSTLYGVEATDSNGKIVNSHIVTGVNSKEENDIYRYFKTSNSNIEIVNSINRANTRNTAFEFTGGEIKLLGGIVKHYSIQAIKATDSKVTSVGAIFVNNGAKKFNLSNSKLTSYGNVCSDGKGGVVSCVSSDNLVKAGSSSMTNFDYKINCQSPLASASTSWLTLNLRNTSAYQPQVDKTKRGVTKICGISSEYKTFRYWTSNGDSQKDVKISNGCVNISIHPGKNVVFKYQLINDNYTTPDYTVKDIGKYLIFAQEYNYFLYAEKDDNKNIASNDLNNLTYWVLKSQPVSKSVRAIANDGIKNKKNYTNTEFIQYAYHGIFGRAVDTKGLETWNNKLATGMSRDDLITNYVNQNEAKAIYSGWGYN